MLLSNLDAQLNSYIRVQNEVAARSLMRDALSTFDSALIPEVYGWSSVAEGQSWIMEQYIPGEPLNNGFEMLSSNQKRDIMAQLARTFILMQSFELPFAINKYGGLRYDDKGEIYNGLPLGRANRNLRGLLYRGNEDTAGVCWKHVTCRWIEIKPKSKSASSELSEVWYQRSALWIFSKKMHSRSWRLW